MSAAIAGPQASASGPELFIGLVGAVGTDMDRVCEALFGALREVNYGFGDPIRVRNLFHQVPELGLSPTPEALERAMPADQRYQRYMTAGNDLRQHLRRGDAAAMLSIGATRFQRAQASGDPNAPRQRYAYVIRSLKHLQEVQSLRRIYRSSFVLLAAYSRRDQRIQELARMIADSMHTLTSADYRGQAEALVQRDEKESAKFGQNVRDTFPQADVFVDADDRHELQAGISRFVHLLFGDFRHTPSRPEQGMFLAKAASLRSSSLARQVGAAITGERGEVLGVGTNEAPRAGGGTYWEGDDPDGREITRDVDISDRFKRNILADVLQRLQRRGWLTDALTREDVSTLLWKALEEEPTAGAEDEDRPPPLKAARVMDIIEFGRSVHAEMCALMDAARLGIPVANATLHTTTFPCHDCARHIVAAGIREVLYVEPYAKSLAAELYPDSVAVETAAERGQLPFVPFIGIAPRRYAELFEMRGERKAAGRAIGWNPVAAVPLNSEEPRAYLEREELALTAFEEAMAAKGLSLLP